MSKHPNVSNAADLEWMARGNDDKFSCECKRLAMAAGGVKLGCNLFRVQPGKRAFPKHRHFANEEAVYILKGHATMYRGDEAIAVGPGDYIVHHAGGVAHQMINSGDEPLEYLCFSTMNQPEVVEYPDSKKLGMITGMPPEGIVKFFPADANVNYWEGE